jgi:hypothetical protein
MTRLRYDERTRRYVSRRSAEALSKPEIIRAYDVGVHPSKGTTRSA